MLDDLDEALRQLMIQELPVKNNEIEISFEAPTRDWSARLSRPTLNLFLYEIRENVRLRQPQPYFDVTDNNDNTATRQQKPIRFDFFYVITAWTAEVDDMHRLLGRALMVLLRHPLLPEEFLTDSLVTHNGQVPIRTAKVDLLPRPSDIWNTVHNDWRPFVPIVVTAPVSPFLPLVEPLVRVRDLRVGQKENEPTGTVRRLKKEEPHDRFWMVGGRLRSEIPLENPRVTLVERGVDAELKPGGKFIIGNLKAGEYTLEVTADSHETTRHKITVPSEDYDLQL